MSNPSFSPMYDTNEIYRDGDLTRCLTDDLDAMDTAIAGKAPTSHTHSEYAANNQGVRTDVVLRAVYEF